MRVNRFLCRVSTSATMPADVITQESVNLVVLDLVLDKMLYPLDTRVSVATVTKSFPAMAKTKGSVQIWLSVFLRQFQLTNDSSFVILVRVEALMLFVSRCVVGLLDHVVRV